MITSGGGGGGASGRGRNASCRKYQTNDWSMRSSSGGSRNCRAQRTTSSIVGASSVSNRRPRAAAVREMPFSSTSSSSTSKHGVVSVGSRSRRYSHPGGRPSSRACIKTSRSGGSAVWPGSVIIPRTIPECRQREQARESARPLAPRRENGDAALWVESGATSFAASSSAITPLPTRTARRAPAPPHQPPGAATSVAPRRAVEGHRVHETPQRRTDPRRRRLARPCGGNARRSCRARMRRHSGPPAASGAGARDSGRRTPRRAIRRAGSAPSRAGQRAPASLGRARARNPPRRRGGRGSRAPRSGRRRRSRAPAIPRSAAANKAYARRVRRLGTCGRVRSVTWTGVGRSNASLRR